MKTTGCPQMGRRFSVLLPPAFSMPILAALLMQCLLPAQARAATNTVTTLADSGPGSLRQTILYSAPGDTITFSVTNGTLNLSQQLVIDKSLNILGPGVTNLTISGNNATRIFLVNNVSALISGFTLRDGQSSNGVDGVVSSPGNPTPGTPGAPGGAISAAGALTLNDCVFQNNAAGRGGNGASSGLYGQPSSGAAGGAGGAIYSEGSLALSNCLLYGNAAGGGGISGSAMDFGPTSAPGGSGGGICAGTLYLYNTIIKDNHAGYGASSPPGAPGANGGSGGGVWCSASLTASNSTFLRNSTGSGGSGGGEDGYAGSGGMGGFGGGIWCGGSLALTNCIVSSNFCGLGGAGGYSRYNSGMGGDAGSGCGIWSKNNAVLVRCTITSNYGNSGGQGGGQGAGCFMCYQGPAIGGSGSSGAGIYASGNLTLTDCTVSRNACGNGGAGGASDDSSFRGGQGGAGGLGGGIFTFRDLSLTNCTVSDNTCGYGGMGGWSMYGGGAFGAFGSGGNGGGIYRSSGTNAAFVVSCSIVGNHAGVPNPGGQMGGDGTGGGVWAVVSVQCLNTIIALNSGVAPDVCGSFTSQGYNLIAVTNGSSGFPGTGDRVGSSGAPLDPKIGPLADNGGPTFTRALLPGSPAIEAGTAIGVPPTDQRGVPRPQGPGVDIGAFEYQYTIPAIIGAAFQGPDYCLRCFGLPGRAQTVQVSTNLLNWSDLSSFINGTNGLFDYVDAAQINHGKRFYRLKYTAP
jgi:hypothetical protein